MLVQSLNYPKYNPDLISCFAIDYNVNEVKLSNALFVLTVIINFEVVVIIN